MISSTKFRLRGFDRPVSYTSKIVRSYLALGSKDQMKTTLLLSKQLNLYPLMIDIRLSVYQILKCLLIVDPVNNILI